MPIWFHERSSHNNNIRLVSDLIEYKDFLDDEHLILFLDFQKAFDTVSHKFIFDTLNSSLW